MFSAAAPFAWAAEKRAFSGVVIDENNEPLVGANIKVDGTLQAAASDLDGRYTLMLPADKPANYYFIYWL